MFRISVKDIQENVTSRLTDFQKKKLPQAQARALNRAASTARGHAARQTAKQLAIPLKAVRKRFLFSKRHRATKQKLTAALHVVVKDIPVIELGKARAYKASKKRGIGGVKIGRRSLPGAFIQKTKRGYVSVWKRKQAATWIGSGKSRTRAPFEQVTMSIKDRANRAMELHMRTTAVEVFKKRLIHEISRLKV